MPHTCRSCGKPEGTNVHCDECRYVGNFEQSVVSSYSDDDAIEDGFLIDITQEVNEVAKCRVKRWLISRALFEAALVPNAEKIGERDGEPILDVRKALLPLLEAFQQAVNKAGAQENEYWWFDFGLDEQVKACHDGQGRITLCFPSDD